MQWKSERVQKNQEREGSQGGQLEYQYSRRMVHRFDAASWAIVRDSHDGRRQEAKGIRITTS